MEFTNEIYFDKNLSENSSVKISYTGKLFKEFSSEVYIVFGYGPNWDNTQEQKMELTEDEFYTTINITGKETFNFCFRNNYNIWDNNNYFNYIAPIAEEEKIPEAQNVKEENIQEYEDVFSNLLDSLLNNMQEDSVSSNDVSLENDETYGLQNYEEAESTNVESLNTLFNEICVEENPSTSTQNIKEEDLDALFDKVFNYDESEQLSSELDELMNNILNSVLETEEISPKESENVVPELPAVVSPSKIDLFFDGSYKFLQKVGLACKKIGELIKIKAQEYGFIKEK